MPVSDHVLTQAPAEIYGAAVDLARKIHQANVEALHFHPELLELTHEAVDSSGFRLNIPLKTIDRGGVRGRPGGQNVERPHQVLPVRVVIDDILDDTPDERKCAVRLLDRERFHVMYRVCTRHAPGQVRSGVCGPALVDDILSMPPTTARMTAEDLTRARTVLGLSPGELAAEIGLTEPVVRAWEDGSLRIPQQYAIQIVWRAAVAERQAALASSGLPECTWVTRWMDAAPPLGAGAQREHLDALRRHAAVCPHCTARARFVEQNFPPMPDLPIPPTVRALRTAGSALKRFPVWLRVTVVGAAVVGVITVLRIAGSAIGGEGPSPLTALRLIFGFTVIGAYLGAVAGITYAVVRDPLRSIGRLGDYVAGVLCVWAYLLASVLPWQFVAERPDFAHPDHAPALALGGAIVGVIIGHLWFRRR